MTGYHVGAVLTALLGILLIPSFGWPAMFVAGTVPALILVPLLWAKLPESAAFLARRQAGGSRDSSWRAERKNPLSTLFRDGFARPTIAFWISSFMGLLLVYGLNTWLPEIMRSAGYELGAALALLLVLNIGAILGLLLAGTVANRIGVRPATIGWFAAATLFLALLSIRLPGIGVYVSVLLAGIFVFSAQVLVYAYVSQLYPAEVRGTALGTASGVGRLGAIAGPIIGGALLQAGIAYPWGFYAFAVVAALGALGVVLVGRAPCSYVSEVPGYGRELRSRVGEVAHDGRRDLVGDDLGRVQGQHEVADRQPRRDLRGRRRRGRVELRAAPEEEAGGTVARGHHQRLGLGGQQREQVAGALPGEQHAQERVAGDGVERRSAPPRSTRGGGRPRRRGRPRGRPGTPRSAAAPAPRPAPACSRTRCRASAG